MQESGVLWKFSLDMDPSYLVPKHRMFPVFSHLEYLNILLVEDGSG